jgi:hypothetical protein
LHLVGVARLPQLLASWPVRSLEDYNNDDNERLTGLKKIYLDSDWVEPYKTAIAAIPDDTKIPRDNLRIWKTQPWNNDNKRITPAGDSAHAMTFREFFPEHDICLEINMTKTCKRSWPGH